MHHPSESDVADGLKKEETVHAGTRVLCSREAFDVRTVMLGEENLN